MEGPERVAGGSAVKEEGNSWTEAPADSQWGGAAAAADNGVMLHMKSRNNANSPHSPAVTMTTEPPEVGGKSQEMEAGGGGRTRGMHVSCFF